MRLTNALVYALTLILGLFGFFSSYIALHHQSGADEHPYDPASAGNTATGDARSHALRFSRGGFNISTLRQQALRTAREELSALKEALHLNQITTHFSDLASTHKQPSATSPAAIRQRHANRTNEVATHKNEMVQLRQQVAALKAAMHMHQSSTQGEAKDEVPGGEVTPVGQVAALTAALKRAQAQVAQQEGALAGAQKKLKELEKAALIGQAHVKGKGSTTLDDPNVRDKTSTTAGPSTSASVSASVGAGASVGASAASGGTGQAVGCRASFEPTCDMYSYVRFWNKRFRPADCYQSPLRHPSGRLAPLEERK